MHRVTKLPAHILCFSLWSCANSLSARAQAGIHAVAVAAQHAAIILKDGILIARSVYSCQRSGNGASFQLLANSHRRHVVRRAQLARGRDDLVCIRHCASVLQGNPFDGSQHNGFSQNAFGAQPHGGGSASQNGFNNQQHQQVCHLNYTQQIYAIQ